MNKKMSKRQRDLKAKLMAAIAMLLVSSIMMVSTTYAWFTLSTAPEVTGITTAVGANGNLEMALLPDTVDLNRLDDASVITSAVGDSSDAANQTVAEANVTWGNLVDLKDNTVYGLDEISLLPAALHLNADGSIGTNPLDRPAYGVDGRVTELKNDVLTGVYRSDAFYLNSYYGVRGVGTSSSMSPRQLAHRSLLQEGSRLTGQAKSTASNALAKYGPELAKLAVNKVNGADSFPKSDVQTLSAVVTELNNALGQVENAIRSYAAANAIADADTEANYSALRDQVLAMSLTDIAANNTYATAGFSVAITKLNETKTNVASAVTKLNELLAKNEKDYAWSEIETPLSRILNVNQLKLNGFAMDTIKQKDENGEFLYIGKVMQAVLDDKGIKLQMPKGSGAYAALAEFCGDYSTYVMLPDGLKVESIPLGGMEAEMQTKCIGSDSTQVASPYMNTIYGGVTEFEAADGAATANALTEFYGYIIDLAFRTNVADSDLLLQTAAANRIYSNSTENTEIMGAGSTMTFTGAEGFGGVSVKNLMEHLRIVFFEPNTNKILSHARLDTINATMDGNTVTANMYLYKDNALATTKETSNIVALEQNKAKAVSVLVYLDGTSITNADVANATNSMTGSMNLQFASSAILEPMEYSALKQGNGGNSTSRVTYTAMNEGKVTVADGASVEIVTAYLVSENETAKGIGVVLDGVPAGQDVYLSINGAEAVKATKGSYSGFTGYGITAEGLTADTTVEVSLQAATNTPTPTPATKYTVSATGTTDVTVVADPSSEVEAGADVTITVTNATDKIYNVLNNGTVIGEVAAKSGENNGSKTFTIDNVAANVVITVAEKTDG